MRAGAGLARPSRLKTGVRIASPSKFLYPDLSQNPAVFSKILKYKKDVKFLNVLFFII